MSKETAKQMKAMQFLQERWIRYLVCTADFLECNYERTSKENR